MGTLAVRAGADAGARAHAGARFTRENSSLLLGSAPNQSLISTPDPMSRSTTQSSTGKVLTGVDSLSYRLSVIGSK